MPSVIITLQKGQAVAMMSALVSRASPVRRSLMRGDSSSIHMRPPPAPQQKLFSEWLAISTGAPLPQVSSRSRGGS